MATTSTTGTTLEELVGTLSGTSTASDLILKFAKTNKLGIVSPTLIGLLDSFKSGQQNAAITSSGVGFCGDFDNQTDDAQTKIDELLSVTKDKEAAKSSDFADAAGEFVLKVASTKASYIVASDTDPTGTTMVESPENAMMRMLGLPDDQDIGSDESLLAYTDPAGKLVSAKLSDLKKSGGGISTNILYQRSSAASDRFYNFDIIKAPADTDTTTQTVTTSSTTGSSTTISSTVTAITTTYSDTRTKVDYFNPAEQMAFYYLKSLPIQDSNIYSCIFETDKIVMKPFDSSSPAILNGNKAHTSLLESIIRLRLDRVTGNPGIYPLDSDGLATFTLQEPKNLRIGDNTWTDAGTMVDNLTQVECFLIDKLRKILFQLADHQIVVAKERSEAFAKAAIKTNDTTTTTTAETTTTTTIVAPPSKQDYIDEIQKLEVLKAKEDAILFLLKDTSSAYDHKNTRSVYSSLQLQSGIIRTSSGFDDILSGPLYSILKQKSDYLDAKITQLKAAEDALQPPAQDGGSPSGIVNSSSGDSYPGVSSEDFVIYCIALLALDENFLIGLLTRERQINLINTISGSILSSNKDPYGLMSKTFPSVLDSVNALAILVSNFYQAYVKYCENKTNVDALSEALMGFVKNIPFKLPV